MIASLGVFGIMDAMKQPFRIQGKIRLKDFNPAYCNGLEKEATRAQTIKWGRRIGELQEYLYANARQSLIIMFQGMDASGKDGAVKRVLEFVNPAGVETTNFKGPSAEERAHDFLWRVHKAVPRYGNIGIFNRSHYEEVLIVRVFDLQPRKIWEARYEQINAFERILSENGVLLLKFFLHLSRGEQAKRFKERLADPSKNWKFSADDLKMREHWDDFQAAFEAAINHCSSKYCPWHIVPADHKWYRDYVIAKTVAKALEGLHMKWPLPQKGLSRIKVH
jgi:PPK2 family polyphosphate:nucleotide phosphotransferase